jgi:ABC-type phosphate transport system permease subunit
MSATTFAPRDARAARALGRRRGLFDKGVSLFCCAATLIGLFFLGSILLALAWRGLAAMDLTIFTAEFAPTRYGDETLPKGRLLHAIAGALALSIIVIPVVVRTTEDMLQLIPDTLRESVIALGAPKWKMITLVCCKAAMSGILTGVLLALARIAGETAPLLLTAFGNVQVRSAAALNAVSRISVRKLDFYYGANKALKGINLEQPDRQVSGMIGPSGCGKSTLLRVLNRMYGLYPGQRAEGGC